ncbi:hypothetical protein EMIT019CA3_60205 [Bacillus pseudomycoides]
MLSLGMGQEEGLIASMHSRMISLTYKERFYVSFSICIYIVINSNFIDETYAITVVYYLVCNSTSNEYAVGGLVYC